MTTAGTGAELRAKVAARFTEWLDDVLIDEAAPPGIAAELVAELAEEGAARDEACDQKVLWSAITSLGHEVKLQSRAFHDLTSRLGAETLRREEERLAAVRAAERRGLVEGIEVLLDARDRIARLASHARELGARRPGFLRALFRRASAGGDAATLALAEGLALCLARLDEALAARSVREIEALGKLHDPRVMKVVGVRPSPSVPDGTVLEVMRRGYWWDDQVHRLAEVVVARAAQGGGS